jgi:DNA repair ATPase RecN
VITPAEAAIAKVTELEVKLSTATEEERGKLNETLLSLKNDENEAVPTIENMTAALQSQIEHLQAYYDNLAKIKAGGFSADVLAMVSGGTAQDMDYAKALADAIDQYGANSDQVRKLNEQVAAVKAKTGELAAAMTENTLAVDENMTELVDNYTKALEGLNQYDGAKANAAQTVQGIVDGLGEKAGQVSDQVNSILGMLAELSGAGYSIPGVNFNSIVTGGAAPQGGTQALNVNSHVYLDGKEITNNVSTHMANDMRAQERSLIE